VIDDDSMVLRLLKDILEPAGYDVVLAADGVVGMSLLRESNPAMVLLDILMPGPDGYQILESIRHYSDVPVIMITGKSEVDSVKQAINLGADDYVRKPFSPIELVARVRAVLRRTEMVTTPTQASFTSGNIKVDFGRRQVTVAGNEVKLTPTEYNLLHEFALNAGKVLTHTYLLNKVWGPEYSEEREYLHVFVRRLRTKLESDPANPQYIVAVPGVGYQLQDAA